MAGQSRQCDRASWATLHANFVSLFNDGLHQTSESEYKVVTRHVGWRIILKWDESVVPIQPAEQLLSSHVGVCSGKL
jgi:hypothetical protein